MSTEEGNIAEILISCKWEANIENNDIDERLLQTGENCMRKDMVVKYEEEMYHEHIASETDNSTGNDDINEIFLQADENRLRNDILVKFEEESFDEQIASETDKDEEQSPSDIQHSCTVCHKSFSELSVLQRHYVKHIVNKPFTCGQCEKSFFTEKKLSKHKLQHNGGKYYTCDICNKSYFTKYRYDVHLQKHWFKDTVCNACFKCFNGKSQLEKHERSHTNLDKELSLYTCVMCDMQFILKGDLEIHMDDHEKVKDHTCEYCDKIFFFRYCMRTHIHSHIDRVSCNLCLEKFQNLRFLNSHELTHIKPKLNAEGNLSYECEACDSTFSLKYQIENHYNSSHEGKTQFSCTVCGEKFFFSYILRNHKGTHKKSLKPYLCDICAKAFAKKNDLVQHQTCHGDAHFVCAVCNKEFQSKWKLKQHHVAHLEHRPHVCSICGTGFRRKENLLRHHQTHSTVRAFKCEKCDETFNVKAYLTNHRKVHLKESNKTYTCRVCERRFFHRAVLGRHISKEHGDLIPEDLKCDICQKVLKSPLSYRLHYKLHTMERDYQCMYCDKAYIQQPHLIHHYQHHHPDMDCNMPYKCHYCHRPYVRKEKLYEHHQKVHPGYEFVLPNDNSTEEIYVTMVESFE